MKALQILKFIYKKDRLNFSTAFENMDEPVVENNCKDLLAGLFTKDKVEMINRLLHLLVVDDSEEQ
jgi:hypothetical protein